MHMHIYIHIHTCICICICICIWICLCPCPCRCRCRCRCRCLCLCLCLCICTGTQKVMYVCMLWRYCSGLGSEQPTEEEDLRQSTATDRGADSWRFWRPCPVEGKEGGERDSESCRRDTLRLSYIQRGYPSMYLVSLSCPPEAQPFDSGTTHNPINPKPEAVT